MKQIKTIRNDMLNSNAFDQKVNEALAEGWGLTKRGVVQEIEPAHVGGVTILHVWLYAELEKETITDAERCCENCKHFDLPPEAEPCTKCSDNASHWEACEP